jgi:hypothetical protein|tara:strand:+ start:1416 stop:1754 length:339 start_codon:yes stop_codon:yes gene_type:complete
MSEEWDYGNSADTNFFAGLADLTDDFVEQEQRMFYNIETGEILDIVLTNKDKLDNDPYIIVTQEQTTITNKVTQRIKNGIIVNVDTSTHQYWRKPPYDPLTTNPYYIGEEND